MVVFSKRSIILPGPGGQSFRMERGYIGPLPAWAEKSAYLKALIADGKVVVTEKGTKP